MLKNRLVIRVALPIPLPRCLDYLAPDDPAPMGDFIGCRIRVPCGRREMIGIVVGTGDETTPDQLRPATAWVDLTPLIDGELADSLRWLAHYTHTALGEIFAMALPGPLRRGAALPITDQRLWHITPLGQQAIPTLKPTSRSTQLLTLLSDGPHVENGLSLRLPGWRPTARRLRQQGYIEVITRPPSSAQATPHLSTPVTLDAQQRAAISAIRRARGFQTYLLDGITGSGKTEVYLHAIADCLTAGRQALLLVPEIGLTPQIWSRLQSRLGVPVHMLHSGLADGERLRVWAAARRGQAQLIVGTRSAVFTPLPRAGLVIVDEEHDSSYKQLEGTRYHARDFVLVRAKALNIPVILGSATPSLESLHNARQSRYEYIRLTQRAGAATSPRVRVIDLRKRPLFDGLSQAVLDEIGQVLRRQEQVLVFKNRRGYAPALFCHDCGWIAHCTRCSDETRSTPLTVHRINQHHLQCHQCGSHQSIPKACPQCGSLALNPHGTGTERLEERLITTFPDYPVLRIDRETIKRHHALPTLLERLGTQPGILVGTQILAKGHDLPALTLVVVVGADEGLFSTDFRANEKLSQQLIQVAGRAGRAQRPGEVWLQTHYPYHPLLQVLLQGGYGVFADAELEQRQAAQLPPFRYLALIRAESQRQTLVQEFLEQVKNLHAHHPAVSAYGPMAAPLPRRAGYLRSQLLFSAQSRPQLQLALQKIIPAVYGLPLARRVRWLVDVDPIDLY